jgi:hypothetical protein
MKNRSPPILATLYGVALTLDASEPFAGPATTNPNLLWYDKPAVKWVQALPIGNGRLGAMIFGQPANDPLPANLQGIWGDGLNMPWQSDYHVNINLEMIYWPAEPANLGQMHLPLLRMTTNLVLPGAKTARAYFGPDTPGWVLGDTGTGWSIACKENLWARLRDGDHAQRLLSNQLRFTEETRVIMADAGGTYPTPFDPRERIRAIPDHN